MSTTLTSSAEAKQPNIKISKIKLRKYKTSKPKTESNKPTVSGLMNKQEAADAPQLVEHLPNIQSPRFYPQHCETNKQTNKQRQQQQKN